MSKAPKEKLVVTKPRTSGAIMLIFSAGLSYWMLYLPTQDAQAQVEKIYISPALIAFSILFFIMGLSLLIFGKKVRRIFAPAPGDSRKPMYIAVGIIVIIGFAIFFLLQDYLEQYGYVFN